MNFGIASQNPHKDNYEKREEGDALIPAEGAGWIKQDIAKKHTTCKCNDKLDKGEVQGIFADPISDLGKSVHIE